MKKNYGKILAYLLRHDKDYEFLEGGYREISDLVKNHGFTKEQLADLVENDDKGRYEFDNDICPRKIRARQGHSVNVDVGLREAIPPKILYHGTSSRFIDKIKKEGIKKMSRLYVQLSESLETAIDVGKRHGGTTYIIEINTEKMISDNVKFFLSNNNVWLTEYIDPKYYEKIYPSTVA